MELIPANDTAKAAKRLGLVHSSTSGTSSQKGVIELTPEMAAIKRLMWMKCGTITAARLLQEECQKGGHRFKVAMVTLTYAAVDGYSPKHVSEFLRHVRQFLKRRGIHFRYVWVMELQKRGAPHYHCLLWLPKGITLPKPDKRGWWVHGFTKIEWARNAVGYIAKYSSKGGDSERFPKGARIHGAGGLNADSARCRRWWSFPRWVRARFSVADDGRRVVGGGFGSRVSGELVPSPYKVLMLGGRLCLINLALFENKDLLLCA